MPKRAKKKADSIVKRRKSGGSHSKVPIPLGPGLYPEENWVKWEGSRDHLATGILCRALDDIPERRIRIFTARKPFRDRRTCGLCWNEYRDRFLARGSQIAAESAFRWKAQQDARELQDLIDQNRQQVG